LIARFVPQPGCGLELPDAFCKKNGYFVKSASSKLCRNALSSTGKTEQGKVGHSRTRAVVLNLFTYLTLFVKQGYQIYPQYIQWW